MSQVAAGGGYMTRITGPGGRSMSLSAAAFKLVLAQASAERRREVLFSLFSESEVTVTSLRLPASDSEPASDSGGSESRSLARARPGGKPE